MLAEELAQGLIANGRLRTFTRNTDLIGAYAEASVRDFVARYVAPLRVSRGGIIYEENCPAKVRQLDTIIWAPCPAPAIFEIRDFALVPRGSAFGYLEIKSSAYSKALRDAADRLQHESELIQPRRMHPERPRALGVICLRKRNQSLPDFLTLSARNLVVLLQETDDGAIKPEPRAMCRLVNFLAEIRYYGQLTLSSARDRINIELLGS